MLIAFTKISSQKGIFFKISHQRKLKSQKTSAFYLVNIYFVSVSDVFSHHQISFSNKERTNEESSGTTSGVNKTEQEVNRRGRGQKGLL